MKNQILLTGILCLFSTFGSLAQVAWNSVPEFTTYTDATNPVKSDGTNLLQGAEYSEWISNNNWSPLSGGPFSTYTGNQFTVGKITYTAPSGRGDSQWMAQLRLNTNYRFDQGNRYSVTFRVKSTAANKFTFKIEDLDDSNRSFYDTYVTLPANQECLFVLYNLPASVSLNQASVVFDAGGAAVGSTIEISDLNIQGDAGKPSGGPMTLTAAPEGYELVWNDEFDSNTLTSKWNPMTWEARHVNNELQTYRPGSQTINDKNGQPRHTAEVKDGKLVITAFKGADGKVYSARMDSHQAGSGLQDYAAWRYGYMEARIKLPEGRGTWPAFWMMPVGVNWTDENWPRCGEIDIMEEVGADPNNCVCSLHAEGHYHANNTQVSSSKHVDNMEGGWITYAMLWNNDNISMYADGQRILSYNNDHNGYVNWPYDRPYYITLNLAWGGDWGGYKGVDESALPAEFEVDYVRVYQLPEKRSLADDGSGTVFVQGPYNGVAKDGIVPSSTFNSSIDNYFPLEDSGKVYTVDFTVGKNLHLDRGSFGFRSEPNAPTSKCFTPAGRTYRARLLENPYLVMDANGNLSIRKDAPVHNNDILTVTLDLTEGVGNGVISVKHAEGEIEKKSYYLIGAKNSIWPDYIGTNDDAWDWNYYYTLEQEGYKHSHTFTVGKDLDPNWVNFKFMPQNNWSGGQFGSDNEWAGYTVSYDGDIFFIGTGKNGADNGNIQLLPGKSLENVDKLTVVLDVSKGDSNAKFYTSLDDAWTNGVSTAVMAPEAADDRWIDLTGRILGGRPTAPGIYIHNHKKILIPN